MGSLWIPLHTTLPRHPKLIRLATKLQVDRVTAVGHVCCLWTWMVEFAPTGDLSSLQPAEVAEAGAWRGDPREFLAALKEAKLVDEDGHLHNWQRYGGYHVAQREKERLRKQNDRSEKKAKRAGKQQKRHVIKELASSAGHPPDGLGTSTATGQEITGDQRTGREVVPRRTTAPHPAVVSPPSPALRPALSDGPFRPVPGHEPLFAEGGFPSSFKQRISAAKDVVKRINEDNRNFDIGLMEKAVEIIATIKREKRPGWEQRVDQMRTNPNYRTRTAKPEVQGILKLWNQRIVELELAASGAEMGAKVAA